MGPEEITNGTNGRMPRIEEDTTPVTSKKIIYADLSYRVMEAVFEVHNTLGPGFTESIYDEALAHELTLRGIACERQRRVEVRYKGAVVGVYRLDMIVEGKIVLELKAASALEDAHRHQLLSYLKATDLRLGVLINFGAQRVQYERIAN